MSSEQKHLFDIAYRMLGSAADAEEMVQEALLRFHSLGAAEWAAIQTPAAYLSTIVTRLCLDRLKSARAMRETYIGPWLPEPLLTTEETAEMDAMRAESISLAFLVLLERLSPLERAAYLLHEVFEYSHLEVAAALGRSPEACRKLLERAKKQITENRPRFAPSKEEHRRVLMQFAIAVESGDATALASLLHDDVRAISDGGGKATASRKILVGIAEVVRLYGGLARLKPADARVHVVNLNGWPGLVVSAFGGPYSAIQLETDGTKIHVIRATLNPDKLTRVAVRD